MIRERLLGLLCCAVALAMACLALPIARAETPAAPMLDLDLTISPGELVAPGDATMTFIISNPTDFDIQNIYLSSADGLLSEPIGQLGPGETLTLTRPHAVTEAELSEGAVRYIVSHDAPMSGGEKISVMLSAYITRSSARPDVAFTRQLSSRAVAPGGQLTIIYKLANNGNVPVTDIRVRDTLGSFEGRLERLAVGASKTFVSRVTVESETQSAASLSYTASGQTITRTLDPLPVRLSSSALEASFSIGRSAFDADRADAVLMLTNTGDDDYTDIAVMDDVYGGIIADGIALPGGSDPREIAYAYPLRGGGEYRWRVTGTSHAGEALDFVTETLTLPADESPSEIGIRLKVRAGATKINRAGRVTFDLELQNTGNTAARQLRVYEVNRGDVRALAVLPTGEPTHCRVSYEVEESGEYIFCVDYTDAEGHARTVSAKPVRVDITPAGISPEAPEGRDMKLEGGSVKMGATSTFTILLVVASAALVSMFTILLVTSLRARQDRRRRAAVQRQRQREAAARADAARREGRHRRKRDGAALPGKKKP